MIKRWHLKAIPIGAVLLALAFGGLLTFQHLTEEPERRALHQSLHEAAPRPGRIVLSLSSAVAIVKAGPPGGSINVESSFDPSVYHLEQRYEEEEDGGWSYHLDFHEQSLLHISVIGIWLGKRSPEVSIEIPADLPLDLEATMRGGYLLLEFADLAVSNASLELDRGVLMLTASEPLERPMDRLTVKGRVGTMRLERLGNASPAVLEIRHGLGAALVDLSGRWRSDADIDFQVAFSQGELQLPHGVRIEWPERAYVQPPAEEELPPPALRIFTRCDIGDIRIAD